MKQETKICLNCKKDFNILVEDFLFYEKINVPPPLWCPDCRSMRRMIFRNERSLHKRKCDITGKDIISIYRADCPYTICNREYYFSEEYNPLSYGVVVS